LRSSIIVLINESGKKTINNRVNYFGNYLGRRRKIYFSYGFSQGPIRLLIRKPLNFYAVKTFLKGHKNWYEKGCTALQYIGDFICNLKKILV
jgi:hypothetical protein